MDFATFLQVEEKREKVSLEGGGERQRERERVICVFCLKEEGSWLSLCPTVT